MQKVKAIPGLFQHGLLVANIDNKKIRNAMKTYWEKNDKFAKRFVQ